MGFTAGPYSVTLGGGALLLGARATVTVVVPGARVGMVVKVSPQGDPGAGISYGGFVSANDQVTAWIMAVVAITPPATVYNVSVEG
jgi:hypothetical protein